MDSAGQHPLENVGLKATPTASAHAAQELCGDGETYPIRKPAPNMGCLFGMGVTRVPIIEPKHYAWHAGMQDPLCSPAISTLIAGA